MKLMPPEDVVDLYNEGFPDNDLLERARSGKALSKLLDRISDPLVVALEGNWGVGKTHFLKRWVGAHRTQNGSKATTVYFDAFAHDYLSDPLPALVSALAERLPKDDDRKIKKVKSVAYKLLRPAARAGLAMATFGATEALNDFGDAAVEAVSGDINSSIDKFWSDEQAKRSAMDEFRTAIEALAGNDEDKDGSSLVFVIDELDRCRPDYALQILEVVKHFFEVPRVHFVLGVNLKALENSVKARYGSDIDATAYLKKFIQISLRLPETIGDEYRQKPNVLVYFDYLIQEMEISKHIAEPLRDRIEIIHYCKTISNREVERIVSSLRLASDELIVYQDVNNLKTSILIDLLITKIIDLDLHQKLLNSSATDSEIVSYYGDALTISREQLRGSPIRRLKGQIDRAYQLWSFIINNGKMSSSEAEYANYFSDQLYPWVEDGETKEIPKKLNNKYLDQFQLYD